jgi:hypothetical protein
MPKKKCLKCLEKKELDLFPKMSRNKDGLDTYCKVCRNEINKQYRTSNPEKLKKARKIDYIKNRETILKQKAHYTKTHAEQKAIYDKEYRKNNIEKITKYKQVWETKHCDEPLFKIKRNLRRRLHHAIDGGIKYGSTFELVGCSAIELKQHLESQFTVDMTWNNYGTYWHIDHIVQCQEFDLLLEAEQKLCFHYSNLRPLEASKNMSKKFNVSRT